ncbi:MAG: ABC transporter permease [Proteobacteria bacterium]|nr:MAG: ABC transporter permease [Pseudomonadota bacterium]
MALSSRIALRYLHASKGNRYFSWITILSVAGLAIGVAALIVVLSVFNGFEFEVRHRLLQSNAHVIASLYPAGLKEPNKWIRHIRADPDFGSKISAISPFIHSESLAKQGSSLVGIIVRGINPKLQNRVQSLDSLIKPESALKLLQDEMTMKALPEVPSVILGEGLFRTLNAKLGTTIALVTPSFKGVSTTATYKVVGTYNSGLKQYDDRLVLLSLSAAQAFTGMGQKVTGLAIGLKNGDDSTTVSETMSRRYTNLTIKEWQSLNRRFFELMDTERFRVGLIVALVGIVAGFNILTTVFVSVSQRQSDISVLKALGSTTPQIMQIFLIQSSLIGVIGSGSGVIMAGLLSWFLQRFPLLELPDPYFLRTLPVQPSLFVYLGVSVAAVAICLLAGVYPAWIASRVAPSEGIRGIGKAL